MSTKKLIVTILSVLVLCSMLLGLCACTSPEDSFKKTEKAAMSAMVDDIKLALNSAEPADTAVTSTATIELNDAILALLSSSMYGVDFSWINDTEIRYTAETDNNGDLLRGYADIVLGDSSLLSLEAIADMAASEMYLLVPQLADKYLDLTEFAEVNIDGTDSLTAAQLPNIVTLLELWQKYYLMFIDGATNVQKTKGTLEVNGVSQSCTIYDVSFTEKEFGILGRAIFEAMIEDEELEETILALAESGMVTTESYYTPEELYDEFINELEASIEVIDEEVLAEDADDSVNEITFTMTSYMDKKTCIARKVWFTDREEDSEIFWGAAKADGKTGYEISVSNSDTPLFAITGEFTETKGISEGELDIRIEDKSALYITVSDVDCEKLDEGYFNGHLSIAFGEDLLDTLLEGEADAGAAFANLSLASFSIDMDIASDEGTSEIKISLVSGKIEAVSVTVKSEVAEAGTIEVPSNAKTDDPDEWAASIDVEAFFNYLYNETELPDDIVTILASLLTGGI